MERLNKALQESDSVLLLVAIVLFITGLTGWVTGYVSALLIALGAASAALARLMPRIGGLVKLGPVEVTLEGAEKNSTKALPVGLTLPSLTVKGATEVAVGDGEPMYLVPGDSITYSWNVHSEDGQSEVRVFQVVKTQ